MRSIKQIIKEIISKRILSKVGSVGENVQVDLPIYFRTPQVIEIGSGCYFGPGCRIEAWDNYNGVLYKPKIYIGNNVKINSTCHIGAINKITICDNVLLGSHVMIIDHAHGESTILNANIHPSERVLYSKGEIFIGEYCWIAENVVILPNVNVGKGTIVGANSVVTKDLPEYCVAAGNPARVVKYLK